MDNSVALESNDEFAMHLDSISGSDHIPEIQEAMECDNSCSHPVVLKQICVTCDQSVESEYGVSFGYVRPGLRFTQKEADRLREIGTNYLLSQKRLLLVLDLDNTLIHSVKVENLSPEEKHIENFVKDNNGKRGLFSVHCVPPRIVKLRPFVQKFLEEASTMFEMYVYTTGSRSYAMDMIKFLDPQNKYFNLKLIAREDSTRTLTKDLDVVLGEERAVVILDDTEQAWPMHRANLIPVQRYSYFAFNNSVGRKFKSLAERKMDEAKQVLGRYLETLKGIHSQFFDQELGVDLATRDVREVIKMVKSNSPKGTDALKGCSANIGKKSEQFAPKRQ
ncbi:hypothetical protein JCGZ_11577 [Jatropha curcas]|uniref:RNA polymerase II C-terminal domain phosphatase-like n=1 Tax=Jatropha curcas TaxID=180498 RepID=A0A067K4S2_JATCU|nr:RNA polymerase II C-terminal domain phosphatase-like 4 [Jatropha curcas]KDP31201.1 hypothetical protein JCGZ_11577 [Jatropha curcas]